MNNIQSFKEKNEKDILFFQQKVEKVKEDYFTFKHYLSDKDVIITTNKVARFRNDAVLLLSDTKVIFLKWFQIKPIAYHDKENDNTKITFAIKLNRNYHKVYEFKHRFTNDTLAKDLTNFDSAIEYAKKQDQIEEIWNYILPWKNQYNLSKLHFEENEPVAVE